MPSKQRSGSPYILADESIQAKSAGKPWPRSSPATGSTSTARTRTSCSRRTGRRGGAPTSRRARSSRSGGAWARSAWATRSAAAARRTATSARGAPGRAARSGGAATRRTWRRRSGDGGADGADGGDGGGYRPRTKEARAAYEAILADVRAALGDAPRDVLAGAAEEALHVLKRDGVRDADRHAELERLLGARVPDERFAALLARAAAAAATVARAAHSDHGAVEHRSVDDAHCVVEVVCALEVDDAVAVLVDVGGEDAADPPHLVLELLPRERRRQALQDRAVLDAAGLGLARRLAGVGRDAGRRGGRRETAGLARSAAKRAAASRPRRGGRRRPARSINQRACVRSV